MRRAAALLCLVAGITAGCGDSGGDKKKYVASGDAICTAYANDIAKFGTPTTLTEIGPYLAKAMPVLERAVGKLEKLDPPSELRDGYEKFRDSATATVQRANDLRRAAAAGDSAEVKALLADAAKASAARPALAKSAGLSACAKL